MVCLSLLCACSEGYVTIVDSMLRPKIYYEPLAQFIKLVAEPLGMYGGKKPKPQAFLKP